MEALKMKPDPIRKLEIVTEMLPDYNMRRKGESDGNNHIIELDVGDGIAFSEGLKKCEKIAVARTVASDKSVFKPHFHKQKEIVVVYEGKCKVWRDVKAGDGYRSTEPEFYSTGDIIIFEPNVSHAVETIGKTKFIAMTIPASKHFPNEPKR